jgi:hypothetical protein
MKIETLEELWTILNSKPAEKWGKFACHSKDGVGHCALGWLFKEEADEGPILNKYKLNLPILNDGDDPRDLIKVLKLSRDFTYDPSAKTRVLRAIENELLGI